MTNKKLKTAFPTVIYPDQVQIHIPLSFKKCWYQTLKQHDHGWLLHPNGKQQLVNLHIRGNESYLSSGFIVAHEFKLNEPANVILEFVNSDNRFKVHFIKNESGCVFMPGKTRRVKKNDAVKNNDPPFISHITESELQAIAAVDFNQPGAYNWTKKITPSVADKKGG
ncbi:hypothetical protein P8452_62045 [Trifolium repens]|nr:hypothetical protein P8452_62045 [Trifolium repens]